MGGMADSTAPGADSPQERDAGVPSTQRRGSRIIHPPRPRAVHTLPGAEGDLPADRFLERETSWLQFNERVLELAADRTIPLLERVRFLAIFARNLDEFFMVRVAGLQRRIATGLAVRTPSGQDPHEVLATVGRCAHALMDEHARLLHDDVLPALARENVRVVRWEELAAHEKQYFEDLFVEQVYPVLTPLAVDPAHPFPYISGLSLNLAVTLTDPRTLSDHFARVKVPPALPRLLRVCHGLGVHESDEVLARSESGIRFLPIEDLIGAHLSLLFPGMEVRSTYTFRVTRNGDLALDEDGSENLLTALERELTRRRQGPPVRLEAEASMTPEVLSMLTRQLRVAGPDVYVLPGPLDLRGLETLADLHLMPLRWPVMQARTHSDLAPVEGATEVDVLGAMRNRDVLLHHPYDSFSTSVQRFLEQAAADPDVLAIKQTLYRTNGNSPIIGALVDAAEAGKQVLAVVEIKARFDEENNISWARELERAGVHVVYGQVGLKTHAKVCLVVRQERGGLQRYAHVGSGNYNPGTARGFEDLGLLTCDPEVIEDVTRLFNQLSGIAPGARFSRLLVGPHTVRTGVLELVEQQCARARAGHRARVRLKGNGLVDQEVVDALYRASGAGVEVDLWVRGICTVRPGLPGLSENIRVRSIVGRLLEHSRALVVGVPGDPHNPVRAFIGSPDMMPRNLDRRVEAMVRLQDVDHVHHVDWLFDTAFAPDTACWELDGDGLWTRRHTDGEGRPLKEMHFEMEKHYTRARKESRR